MADAPRRHRAASPSQPAPIRVPVARPAFPREAVACRRVLITRPQPGAGETARRLAALGWHPIVAPMLELRSRLARLPTSDAVQAVLVTSASALPALASLRTVPMLTVGDATAAAARAAGFPVVASAGRDAEALARLAAATCDPAGAPLLLASAVGQGATLAAGLRASGFGVLRRAVYDARPVETLPANAAAALAADDLDAAVFFSPATARAFVRALRLGYDDAAVARIDALAISSATEVALAPLPWKRIRVASRPNQDELLALLT